jgi:hypothetical protein
MKLAMTPTMVRRRLVLATPTIPQRWLVGKSITLPRGVDADLPPHHLDTIFGAELQRFRIGPAFFGEYPRTERLRGIVFKDWDGALQDDRTVIVLVIHEVNGTAADLGPVLEDRFVDPSPIVALPTKGRNQARMNIDHSMHEFIGNQDVLKVAPHDHQFRSRRAAVLKKLIAVLLWRGKVAPTDQPVGDVRTPRVLDSASPLVAANHETNIQG